MELRLYDNISKLVRSRGMTIRDLENVLGFANGSVSKWNVSDPGIKKLIRVSELLDVSVEAILFGYEVDRDSKVWTLKANGRLVNMTNNLMFDTKFDVIGELKNYNKIAHDYSFYSFNNFFVSENSIFIFEKQTPNLYLDPSVIKNFSTILISSRNFGYYIGIVEYHFYYNDFKIYFRPLDPRVVIPEGRDIIPNANGWYINPAIDEFIALCRGVYNPLNISY